MTEVLMPKQARQPEIMAVMVGTAGHVDHGKTSLVKLLTGCDTDRLPEEKKRGMSIDLGFAPCLLTGSRMVGIIDVPGHEDFIKNMVAGASSIDVLMLVIAADDGIMPQTVEHLKIVSLLRTPKVMAVITKSDLVSAARCEEVQREVAAFLAQYGFPDAPVIPASNRTGDGICEVRDAVTQLADEVKPDERERPFRMSVERVFSVQGYGTVATGIPVSGRCKVGDSLELLPGHQSTSVRTLQRYKRESGETTARICSALNLRNIRADEIERGMILVTPGVYRETFSAILSAQNVHETLAIKRRSDMHFLYGTSLQSVSAALLGLEKLLPGERGFMRIKCLKPMVLAAGDRFILRSLSPATTVAGGLVLSIRVDKRRKARADEMDRLKMAREAAEAGDVFQSELLAGNAAVIAGADLPGVVQAQNGQMDQKVSEKERCGVMIPLGASHWLIQSRKAELEEALQRVLGQYHRKKKYARGMPSEEVCAALRLDKSCFEGLKKVFEENGPIVVYSNAFALKDFKPALSQRQNDLKEKITARVIESGRSGIARGDLQAQLGADDSEMQLLVRLLSEEGMITVADYYLLHPAVVKGCFEKFSELSEVHGIVELGVFREALGLKRNLAVAILDLFDSKGITRREGKGRKLLKIKNQPLVSDKNE